MPSLSAGCSMQCQSSFKPAFSRAILTKTLRRCFASPPHFGLLDVIASSNARTCSGEISSEALIFSIFTMVPRRSRYGLTRSVISISANLLFLDGAEGTPLAKVGSMRLIIEGAAEPPSGALNLTGTL